MLGQILFRPSNYWGELVPLREWLFVVQYNLFGARATGYHLVSLLLYGLVGLAVYSFLRIIQPDEPAERRFAGFPSRSLAALFLSLLFLAHPLQVEAFAYIASQKDLLFALFSLVSLTAFWKYFNGGNGGRWWLGIGLAGFYLALLSKVLPSPSLCWCRCCTS